MNWIEAINLTLALPEDQAKLYDIVKEVKSAMVIRQDCPVKIALYRSIQAKTNWIIHLSRDSAAAHPGKTKIGRVTAEILGKMGHVEHAVWRKVKYSLSQQ